MGVTPLAMLNPTGNARTLLRIPNQTVLRYVEMECISVLSQQLVDTSLLAMMETSLMEMDAISTVSKRQVLLATL